MGEGGTIGYHHRQRALTNAHVIVAKLERAHRPSVPIAPHFERSRRVAHVRQGSHRARGQHGVPGDFVASPQHHARDLRSVEPQREDPLAAPRIAKPDAHDRTLLAQRREIGERHHERSQRRGALRAHDLEADRGELGIDGGTVDRRGGGDEDRDSKRRDSANEPPGH